MAWRIDEAVIRGVIDNRVRGRLTGRIWLVGRDLPMELDLMGDAWRDVAGRCLEFSNPQPKPVPAVGYLAQTQTGPIGDCTASRRVKVPEVSIEEVMTLSKQGRPFPWHWSNSLYLEWFSATNGRVVIESASFNLTIDPTATWEMTADEEVEQRQANAEAMRAFFEKMVAPESEENLVDADADDNDADRQAPKPMSEEEAERSHEEHERLMDRIEARMTQEGDAANFEQILEEELERQRKERGEPPPTAQEEAERDGWLEEMNHAAEATASNPDPELDELLSRKHPVAEQAHALALRLMREPEGRGWVPKDATQEHPLIDLAAAMMKASAKLAGALNRTEWPPDVQFCATTLVRLKRARDYLGHALVAAESCAQEMLAEPAWLALAHRELTALASECDALIGELRAKLERGVD